MAFLRPTLFALMFGGVLAIASCSDEQNSSAGELPDAETAQENDAATQADSGAQDGTDASTNDSGLTGKCADAFGDQLTEGFGRIDGIVYAVQKPSDTQCTLPNDDHVIVQVLMKGAVYRLVTNVLSTGADPNVRYAVVPHALPPPAFEEGWHAGAALDYPNTLDVHNDDFTPCAMDDLVAKIAADVKVGEPVSVYAHSGAGRPESAHKVHRNSGANEDGAIVVNPTGSPKFLLFHFDEQVF